MPFKCLYCTFRSSVFWVTAFSPIKKKKKCILWYMLTYLLLYICKYICLWEAFSCFISGNKHLIKFYQLIWISASYSFNLPCLFWLFNTDQNFYHFFMRKAAISFQTYYSHHTNQWKQINYNIHKQEVKTPVLLTFLIFPWLLRSYCTD